MNRSVAIFTVCFGLATSIPLGQAAERIFVYPAQGQSEAQLSEDRYQCHRWAVEASGFNPMNAVGGDQPEYVRVPVPENPQEGATGKGMLGGAIAGAAIGEIDANNPGRGAAIGAIVGAILGSIVEQEGETESRKQAERRAREVYQDRREVAVGRANYRRALAACLEGRGYNVN